MRRACLLACYPEYHPNSLRLVCKAFYHGSLSLPGCETVGSTVRRLDCLRRLPWREGPAGWSEKEVRRVDR